MSFDWVGYAASRTPLVALRSQGDCAKASVNEYSASFHPPPRMKRCRPLALAHHSRTLPAMSSVPHGPSPVNRPTGAVPLPPKLLRGTVQLAAHVPAASLQWYTVGSDRLRKRAYAAASNQLRPATGCSASPSW